MAKTVRTKSRALQASRALGRTPMMAAAMRVYAEAGEKAAKDIAPVGRYAGGGDYRDGIEATVGVRGARGGVIVGRVNAKDFKSHWIEFGTIRQPAKAVLRRALERVGFIVYRRRR